MSDLIQLVYASRSNLDSKAGQSGINPGVARILTQSRRNNNPKDIGGVLCFGDDHFFQCLEGERDVVEGLYERLHEDDRHRDVTLLLKRPIEERRFKLWAMKYLSVDREIRATLEQGKLDRFDPYRFDDALIEKMLTVLQSATESQRSSAGDRPQASAGGGDSLFDNLPLVYLGIGAGVAALVVILLVAIGLR